jgi:hypothetical protein
MACYGESRSAGKKLTTVDHMKSSSVPPLVAIRSGQAYDA